MRVSDIDLWEAPLAFVGQDTAEVRAKLEGAEVPWALLVDGERKPLGWLSERDLAAGRVPQRPDISPDPLLDRDDVLRDALSDLLQSQTHYAPVVDAGGATVGILSLAVISDFLASDGGEGRGAPADRAAAGLSRCSRFVAAAARPGPDP